MIWRVEASPLNPAAPVALDGQVAQFTPTQPGTYYVTVNATDDLGEEDGTYLKLVVAKASAPVFQGNTIRTASPERPGCTS